MLRRDSGQGIAGLLDGPVWNPGGLGRRALGRALASAVSPESYA